LNCLSVKMVREKKLKYAAKLTELLETCPRLLIVTVDFVGSKQLQHIRMALRGKATILMGKNTMIRTSLRNHAAVNPDLGLDELLKGVQGNMGFIFCHAEISEIREILEQHKVPAAAKAGQLAQCDVYLEAGTTGMDPSQTAFFQTLNVPTKIVKGQIEIVTRQLVCKVGGSITASEAVLLVKMNMKPFEYGVVLQKVFENGSLFSKDVLDITDGVLISKFMTGAGNVAALGREVGVPTEAGLPHMVSNCLKNMAALCADIDYDFEEIAKLKEFLANPEAFAAANACSAPAAGGGAAPAAAAAKAAEPEEEEEDMDFDLFG